MDRKYVILNYPVLIDTGYFLHTTLTIDEAHLWLSSNNFTNNCNSPALKLLGLEPIRKVISIHDYDEALCIHYSELYNHDVVYTHEELLKLISITLVVKLLEVNISGKDISVKVNLPKIHYG